MTKAKTIIGTGAAAAMALLSVPAFAGGAICGKGGVPCVEPVISAPVEEPTAVAPVGSFGGLSTGAAVAGAVAAAALVAVIASGSSDDTTDTPDTPDTPQL